MALEIQDLIVCVPYLPFFNSLFMFLTNLIWLNPLNFFFNVDKQVFCYDDAITACVSSPTGCTWRQICSCISVKVRERLLFYIQDRVSILQPHFQIILRVSSELNSMYPPLRLAASCLNIYSVLVPYWLMDLMMAVAHCTSVVQQHVTLPLSF